MDDVVVDLLNAKWNTFIKFRWVWLERMTSELEVRTWQSLWIFCFVRARLFLSQNRFYRCFSFFCLYFAISLLCFTLRPSPLIRAQEEVTTPSYTTTADAMPAWSSAVYTSDVPHLSTSWPPGNETIDPSLYDELNATVSSESTTTTTTVYEHKSPATSTSPMTTPKDEDDHDDNGFYSCDLKEVC